VSSVEGLFLAILYYFRLKLFFVPSVQHKPAHHASVPHQGLTLTMSSRSRSSSIASADEALELRLDPSTLLLLDNFLAEKASAERFFHELEDQAFSETQEKKRISVDEFRTAFAEDWQLSQFW
jgi:hypothetical protein